MESDLDAIKKAFAEYQPTDADFWFVDMFVVPHITPDNVISVFKLLSEHNGLNKSFWAMVNRAPTTDEGWNSLMWIGSGVSEEVTERRRRKLREAVETVRASLGSEQVQRNALFRKER
jgi:hypothetical protein